MQIRYSPRFWLKEIPVQPVSQGLQQAVCGTCSQEGDDQIGTPASSLEWWCERLSNCCTCLKFLRDQLAQGQQNCMLVYCHFTAAHSHVVQLKSILLCMYIYMIILQESGKTHLMIFKYNVLHQWVNELHLNPLELVAGSWYCMHRWKRVQLQCKHTFDELLLLTDFHRPDVICITESWLCLDILDSECPEDESEVAPLDPAPAVLSQRQETQRQREESLQGE